MHRSIPLLAFVFLVTQVASSALLKDEEELFELEEISSRKEETDKRNHLIESLEVMCLAE